MHYCDDLQMNFTCVNDRVQLKMPTFYMGALIGVNQKIGTQFFLSLGLATEVPKLTHYWMVQFHPRAQAKVTSRLCPLNVRFLCVRSGDDVVPSFLPPPRFIRAPCSKQTSCPSPLSFLPICPLSARFCVFSHPPPVSCTPHRRSPIVRPSKSYQPSGFGRPMSSSGFPTQRPICKFAPPLDLCGWWYLAWVWVGRGVIQ